MAVTNILRVRRTDDPNAHLLLHITQTSATKTLDLKLVATEHEHLYHGTTRTSSLGPLQASTFDGDESEWRNILFQTLLPRDPSASGVKTEGIELVAAISGAKCTLTIRRNIEKITQRLGSIILQQDDEREEISAFEWVDTALINSQTLSSQLAEAQKSISDQQAQVAKLTKQLDELVEAKREHEKILVSKFVQLLNAKKGKVRDLLRVVGGQPGTAVAPPRGKRKARGDDEAMDVDDDAEDEVDGLEEDGERGTPEGSTGDEGSDGEGQGLPLRGKADFTSTGNGTIEEPEAEEDAVLPPRRELPFTRTAATSGEKAKATKIPVPTPDDDDDTDDEL
nr:hypothetical protein B0A51_13484 [Rachicladosporium sp. CCFEE 5018]OQO30812.1 hypothetical protein B0A51_01473 [Rachicladosporium sp. CCFEE 5018]